MKLFIFVIFLGISVGDRLENTYIPPSHAFSSGGNGNLLSAPINRGSSLFRQSSSFSATSFLPHVSSAVSAQNVQIPSVSYGLPVNQARVGGIHIAQQVPILKLNNNRNGFGGYSYEYETANGISAHESGQLKQVSGQEVNAVHGSYSYTGPDGRQYTVHYTADENGFRAHGDHLPTPPPIPQAILKSLQYNAQHGYPGSYQSARLQSRRNPESRGYQNGDSVTVDAASKRYLAPRNPVNPANSGYRY